MLENGVFSKDKIILHLEKMICQSLSEGKTHNCFLLYVTLYTNASAERIALVQGKSKKSMCL